MVQYPPHIATLNGMQTAPLWTITTHLHIPHIYLPYKYTDYVITDAIQLSSIYSIYFILHLYFKYRQDKIFSTSDGDSSDKWKWGHVFIHNLCAGVRHEYFPPFPTPYCNVHTSYLYLLGKYCYCKLLCSRGSVIVDMIIYGYTMYYELPLFLLVQKPFHSFLELDFRTRQTSQ